MKPLETLKRVAKALEKQNCKYCLIGGHAASLYRSQERFTKDVDFALTTKPPKAARQVALKTLQGLGLKPMVGFIPKRKGEGRLKTVCMVTSAPPPGETKGIVDILLPELPWIESAVARAQYNRIDLGFAEVPVITPEDLVIAKCYALKNSPDRFQDLDDLKEIFQSVPDLDLDYLRQKFEQHHLSIPQALKKYTKLRMRRQKKR